MRQTLALTILIALSGLAFTSSDALDLRPYFFPASSLEEPVVYRYASTSNPNDMRYLHLQPMLVRGEIVLTSRWYGQDLRLTEMYTERLQKEHRAMLAYVCMHEGVLQAAKPMGKAMLPWAMEPGETHRWNLAYDGQSTLGKFSWTHKLLGSSTPVEIESNTFETIQVAEHTQYYGDSEPTARTAVYAHGLGLYSWTETLPDGNEQSFQFNDKIDFSSWELMMVK